MSWEPGVSSPCRAWCPFGAEKGARHMKIAISSLDPVLAGQGTIETLEFDQQYCFVNPRLTPSVMIYLSDTLSALWKAGDKCRTPQMNLKSSRSCRLTSWLFSRATRRLTPRP